MSSKKSRPYSVDGSQYSFEFGDDGKLIGIKKEDDNGEYQPVDPASVEFSSLELSEEALDAYNVNKFGGNLDAYEEIVDISTDLLVQQFHDDEEKKSTNQAVIAPANTDVATTSDPGNLAFRDTKGNESGSYEFERNRKVYGQDYINGEAKALTVLAYPYDIDPHQDHMKITKYNYERKVKEDLPNSGKTTNKTLFNLSGPGDDVTGNTYMGSVVLPMPKVTDVNGVDYGENKLSLGGLAAMSGLNVLDYITREGVKEEDAASLKSIAEIGTDIGLKKEDLKSFGEAVVTSGVSQIAGALTGTNLEPNTILARRGGKVLNPNAEMLFDGPVIRDFNFDFLMIARSEREGKEIRKIIRFFKLGMAPKYQDKLFLQNPDVFVLEYKNGPGQNDTLNTVNRFASAMALQTMSIDYAPNGYWSAYRDSQPVALKMSLNFTELRPVYQADQLDTPEDSVGY